MGGGGFEHGPVAPNVLITWLDYGQIKYSENVIPIRIYHTIGGDWFLEAEKFPSKEIIKLRLKDIKEWKET